MLGLRRRDALAPCVEVQGGLHRALRCTSLWHACAGCAQQSWHDACHNILAQAIWRGKRLSRDWRLRKAVVPRSGTGASPSDRTREGREPFCETDSDLGNLLVNYLETSVDLVCNVYNSVCIGVDGYVWFGLFIGSSAGL